jgi:adenosine deaminase
MSVTNLKKVELHRHLELSVRKSTILELAPQFGIKLKNDNDFNERFIIREPMLKLDAVLNKFLDTQLLWASEGLIERMTYEACEDAHNEGIRILELRYAPTFIRYRHDNLDFESIHEAIVRGMTRAEKDFKMAIGLICIIQRILPVKEAEAVTQFAIDHKDSFIGLDLADNEEGFDSKPFAPFFLKAKNAGLGITVHAGEINSKKAPFYPKDAIEHLGAARIGHGVQVYREPNMISYLKERGIVLELCPTSNYLTQAIPGEIKNHPFKMLLESGLKVTINTDDPGIFATNMNQEYKLLEELFAISEKDFITCNETAYKASFISENKKKAVW